MRLLIDILHPAHVHFFRNFVQEARRGGHDVLIAGRDKDLTLALLDAYQLDYRLLSTQGFGTAGLARELGLRTARLIREAWRFRPDAMLGIMGPCIALAGSVLPARVVTFYDNESAGGINNLVHRLSDAYLAPEGFTTALGNKLIRYPGYHELAYLHPRWFTPDPSVALQYGIAAHERVFFVRFVGYNSSHDFGEYGFSAQGKRTLIRELSAYGRVLVSSEAPLPPDLEAFAYDFPVEHVHHLLARADLFVGESSTMASEAVILGTHSLFLSRTGRGVNDQQSAAYSHTWYFRDTEEATALRHIRDLCKREDLKPRALAQRERLVRETCDPTQALLEVVNRHDLSAEASAPVWRKALRESFQQRVDRVPSGTALSETPIT